MVVPTIGRDTLHAVIRGLAAGPGPWPRQVIVVDDRRGRTAARARPAGRPAVAADGAGLRRSGPGGGPQRRLAGRTCAVGGVPRRRRRPPAGVAGGVGGGPARRRRRRSVAGPRHGAPPGRIAGPPTGSVRLPGWPPPAGSRPTWRCAGTPCAASAASTSASRGPTARTPTSRCGCARAGSDSSPATRCVAHPVRPAPWTVSIRRQAGNVDDALMRRKHGRSWRRATEAGTGRLAHHAATTAALVFGAVLCCRSADPCGRPCCRSLSARPTSRGSRGNESGPAHARSTRSPAWP